MSESTEAFQTSQLTDAQKAEAAKAAGVESTTAEVPADMETTEYASEQEAIAAIDKANLFGVLVYSRDGTGEGMIEKTAGGWSVTMGALPEAPEEPSA